MQIIAYLKSKCERSKGVCSILEKYALEYESMDIDQTNIPQDNMAAKASQQTTPCVEINGVMLADTSGHEVEKYLLSKNLVKSSMIESDASYNFSFDEEENNDSIRSKITRFF